MNKEEIFMIISIPLLIVYAIIEILIIIKIWLGDDK